MRQFELKRTLFGADITVQVTVLDEGVHVLLTGGECSHVGTVALAQNGELLACPYFPGHKEQVVCEHWALAMSREAESCVTVACGVHYGHITPEKIQAVLDICDKLLEETLRRIKRR